MPKKTCQASITIHMIVADLQDYYVPVSKPPYPGLRYEEKYHTLTVQVELEEGTDESVVEQVLEEALALAMHSRQEREDKNKDLIIRYGVPSE